MDMQNSENSYSRKQIVSIYYLLSAHTTFKITHSLFTTCHCSPDYLGSTMFVLLYSFQ